MKEPYSENEVTEIARILNNGYLQLTGFSVEGLQIVVKKRYFFNSSKREDTSAYVPSFILKKNGEILEHIPLGFLHKTTQQDVAFHLAHEIWAHFDGKYDSQLWENL